MNKENADDEKKGGGDKKTTSVKAKPVKILNE
jgi:hypothetical protein